MTAHAGLQQKILRIVKASPIHRQSLYRNRPCMTLAITSRTAAFGKSLTLPVQRPSSRVAATGPDPGDAHHEELLSATTDEMALGNPVSSTVSLRRFMATSTTQGANYPRQLSKSASKSCHAKTPQQVECWETFQEDCMGWFNSSSLPEVNLPAPSTNTAALTVWEEAGVRSFLDWGLFAHVHVVLKSGALGSVLEIAKPSGLAGDPDRAVCVAGTAGSDVLLPIEVKHGGLISNTEGLHMYRPPSKEDRTALQRVVEQVYGCMKKNGFSYAVVCDDQQFWFAKTEGDRLCFSCALRCWQTNPTVVIAMCYVAHLACLARHGQQLERTAPVPPASSTCHGILPSVGAARQPGTYRAADVALGVLIGRGSVASLYRGSLHGQPLAVKVAHPHTSRTHILPQGKFVPRLVAYGTLMSDAGEPFPFLATSLIGDGLPLHEAAATLPRSQLGTVARAAMAAVAGIHDLGVVHGDVRSPNVLLAADGSVALVDLDETVLQPTQQDYQYDLEGMHGVLTEMAQHCLRVDRQYAADVVQQWLSGTDTC